MVPVTISSTRLTGDTGVAVGIADTLSCCKVSAINGWKWFRRTPTCVMTCLLAETALGCGTTLGSMIGRPTEIATNSFAVWFSHASPVTRLLLLVVALR